MRVLWVKAGKILPVDTGGKIRSFNILRHLARHHEITFLSYYDGEKDDAYERELRELFPGAIVMQSGHGASTVAQGLLYGRRIAAAAPFSVTKFTSRSVQRAVADAIARVKPDVAVCDFLAASLNFADPLPVPTVLFQHNVESALWDRQARHEHNPLKRVVFTMEAAKMRRYEARTVGRFNHVIAVSGHDKSLMSRMVSPSAISIVPTGVDVGAFRRTTTEVEPASVVFLGSMDWPANIDGVELFAREIWPLVTARVPHAVFKVVGRRPPARIQGLASDSVQIVGGVDSVTPYLHAATAFVVPLRIGGGTRLKIYEAMAAGCAIVSTSVGAEGLEYDAGRDILIEETPSAFAEAVVGLLTDATRRRTIGAAAFETASRFDWSAVAREFASVLDHARSATSPASPPM